MPESNFNKVSTLWTCQTYMSTVLKPGEILFRVLVFRQILRQLWTFLKLRDSAYHPLSTDPLSTHPSPTQTHQTHQTHQEPTWPDHFSTLWRSTPCKPNIFWNLMTHWSHDHHPHRPNRPTKPTHLTLWPSESRTVVQRLVIAQQQVLWIVVVYFFLYKYSFVFTTNSEF